MRPAMNLLRPVDRDVVVNGLKLHLLDWGGDGRIPLVLLHGFTGNAHAWDTLSIALQPHFHVYAVDWRPDRITFSVDGDAFFTVTKESVEKTRGPWVFDHPFVRNLPTRTSFYFVHSYAADIVAGVTVGTAEHGRPFSAAIARENVFATQFHPEKSSDAGLAIYEAFVKEAAT